MSKFTEPNLGVVIGGLNGKQKTNALDLLDGNRHEKAKLGDNTGFPVSTATYQIAHTATARDWSNGIAFGRHLGNLKRTRVTGPNADHVKRVDREPSSSEDQAVMDFVQSVDAKVSANTEGLVTISCRTAPNPAGVTTNDQKHASVTQELIVGANNRSSAEFNVLKNQLTVQERNFFLTHAKKTPSNITDDVELRSVGRGAGLHHIQTPHPIHDALNDYVDEAKASGNLAALKITGEGDGKVCEIRKVRPDNEGLIAIPPAVYNLFKEKVETHMSTLPYGNVSGKNAEYIVHWSGPTGTSDEVIDNALITMYITLVAAFTRLHWAENASV